MNGARAQNFIHRYLGHCLASLFLQSLLCVCLPWPPVISKNTPLSCSDPTTLLSPPSQTLLLWLFGLFFSTLLYPQNFPWTIFAFSLCYNWSCNWTGLLSKSLLSSGLGGGGQPGFVSRAHILPGQEVMIVLSYSPLFSDRYGLSVSVSVSLSHSNTPHTHTHTHTHTLTQVALLRCFS